MATVLIVDDEPDIVFLLRINLERAGHEVLSAADGEEAVACARARHPDVIVLDVMMPKLDGWGVLERLKADRDLAVRTIPVVMLTALTADHDQVRSGIEGAIEHLSKPVAPEALVAAVEAAMAGDPEPAKRKATQQRALTRLARMETGRTGDLGGRQPRLGGLEHARSSAPQRDVAVRSAARAETLTDKQRHLLRALRGAPSVSEAAAELGMSRSNIYASLRRVSRKLEVSDVTELLRRLRAGELAVTLDR